MDWYIDDEGEERLDGKGSLNNSVYRPLPPKASFLLLNKVTTDAIDYIHRNCTVYEKDELESAKREISAAHHRILEALELMPEAYTREAQWEPGFKDSAMQAEALRPNRAKNAAANILTAIWRRLHL